MTTKPKTRKAPTAARAAPFSHSKIEMSPRRDVVLTRRQRDEINDILDLVRAMENAIAGSGIEDHDMNALCVLARTIEDRITALNEEFDAFAESEAA